MYKYAFTHAGTFHADDLFSAALLCLINENVEIKRVFKAPTEIKDDEIVFDIGLGKFDHHQKDAPIRPNGIKYAAFGLLWREFGRLLIEDEEGWRMFDEQFVQPIDAQDNGQRPEESPIPVMSLSSGLGLFNPLWDSEETGNDHQFKKALEIATMILGRAISSMKSKLHARDIVYKAVENSSDHILVLDRFVPWQDWIFKVGEKAENLLYVVFPSNRGGYNVQAVPISSGSFESRKKFPGEWCGKNPQELVEMTGIESLNFVHSNGFLAATGNLEDAVEVARLAVEA